MRRKFGRKKTGARPVSIKVVSDMPVILPAMKMTKEEVLDLIARVDHPKLEYTRPGLIQHYAGLLADISEKVSQRELSELLAVGVGFYQMGFEEWKSGIDRDALFKALQDRQDKERKH